MTSVVSSQDMSFDRSLLQIIGREAGRLDIVFARVSLQLEITLLALLCFVFAYCPRIYIRTKYLGNLKHRSFGKHCLVDKRVARTSTEISYSAVNKPVMHGITVLPFRCTVRGIICTADSYDLTP
jgi:hypothetical protein